MVSVILPVSWHLVVTIVVVSPVAMIVMNMVIVTDIALVTDSVVVMDSVNRRGRDGQCESANRRGRDGQCESANRRDYEGGNIWVQSRNNHDCREFAVFVDYGGMIDHAECSERMYSRGCVSPYYKRTYDEGTD